MATDNKNLTTTEVENQEKVETHVSNTIYFNEGTIQHKINVDKYAKEIKESYSINDKVSGEKFSIKKELMTTLAELLSTSSTASLLLRNGWEGSEGFSSGSGIALKGEKKDSYYELTFYEGELGKQFDVNKIIRKSFIKIDKEPLDALFTWLLYSVKIEKEIEEELKKQRTTLNLG